jgi:hypothetical protein
MRGDQSRERCSRRAVLAFVRSTAFVECCSGIASGAARHWRILHSTLWCFNAFFGAFAVFAAIGIGMRRQKLGQLWPWLLLWPAYQALITVAAWRAGIELWRDPFG